MQANTTLGGFSNGRIIARLSGIPFAGVLDTIPMSSLTVSSADIKYYQQALNTINKSALPLLVVDGKLGPKTYARVSEFQRVNNLLVTGALDSATIQAIAAQDFATRNPNIKPTPIISSGEADAERRRLTLINFNAVKAVRPDCRLTADGFSWTCPDTTPGFFDTIADTISSAINALAPAKETVQNVAAASAKGFGQGLGATLPYAPLVYVGGAVVGIIILKKFF